MKHFNTRLFAIYVPVLIISLFFAGCKSSSTQKETKPVDPAFTTYVAGFTDGIVPNNTVIQVRLQEIVPEEKASEKLAPEIFYFSPVLAGEAYWIDRQTIGFRSSRPLPSGEIFKVKFQLGKVISVPKRLAVLEFQFKVRQQAIGVSIEKIETYRPDDLSKQKLTGKLSTADFADPADVENLLKAEQNGKELPVRWEHPGNRLEHIFTVDSVQRTDVKSEVLIQWDGKAIGAGEKESKPVEIPALGDFKVMNVQFSSGNETEIRMLFSDPVMEGQELDGLVYLKSGASLKFITDGNTIKAYTRQRLEGSTRELVVDGVRNSMGYTLSQRFEKTIVFYSIKPDVELIGKGVILPESQGLIFPFKAVNLSAVNVRIIKIFQKNIPQFFQTNQYDGFDEINRVGRIIYKNTVQLTSEKSINYSKWNNFSLDLSKLIQTEPGAMYQVQISFEKSQSLYPCSDNDQDSESGSKPAFSERPDSPVFDQPGYYSDYDYDYDSGYRWKERNDPCKKSYYMYGNHSVARNVMASNLGIITKGGDGKTFTVAVTDLRTTETLPDADVSFYNYQNQLVGSGRTNSDGLLSIDIEKKPFLLIARKGNETGYLRLDDGSSLSLSMFDIAGDDVNKGVKGFIYGDRGVWRPGDSIYVSFILEDKNNVIPENHPVIFELFTPENILYQKKVKTASVTGIYDFRTATAPGAGTGNWLAKVTVGGSSFTKTLKIETVKPNRLKINLDFHTSILKSKANTKADLDVRWLHGAVAKNLDADVKVTLSEGKTQFSGFTGYVFDDPSRKFESEEQTLFKGKVNEQGKAVVPLSFAKIKNAPGMLKASFNLRAFEKGGDFSTDRVSIPFSPYPSYVGVKVPKGPGWNDALYSNEPNLIPIATVDENGKPVDRKKVEIKIYEIEWRWWWERTDGDDLARYISGKSTRLLKTDFIDTKNGKALYEMNLGTQSWGRKLIRVIDPVSKHSAGQVFYTSYKGWWENPGQGNPGGAEMLSFSTDKTSYKVGETVQVDLPSSQKGKALVSLESGSKVINAFWVETGKDKHQFSFTATPEMAPNVYIHLSYIQPHNQVSNDLPIRLYGIQPIEVEDPGTHLQPEITMDDVLEPESTVRIKVKEKNGKKMAFTLAVVDEGLLDLTRFKTPDPWHKFYAREALGIKTWDLYQYVMGAFSGEMAGLLALGGDEAIINKAGSKANRFQPVVKFFGPFGLEASKSKTIEFSMPNYVGSVKTMLVAAHEGAYGSTEKVTPVKKPLMVLATLPRVLSPSEQVKLPVTVFVMDPKVKNVTVKVSTNSLFQLNGPAEKQISFSEEGDQIVYFDMQVLKKIGVGKVDVQVKSGSETASYPVEMNVRLPNPPVTKLIDGIIEPGKTWQSKYSPVGVPGTNSGILEVSSIPSLNLGKRLTYLIDYPYGCIEQTISSVFPQLYLDKLTSLTESQKADIEKNIAEAIKKLKNFQLSSGGLSYWPGQYDEASEWGTSYTGHFLLEAKEKGYSLPVGFLNSWIDYQKQKANNWSLDSRSSNYYKQSSQLIQAYRLYTLALAGEPVLGAMNRMKEMPDLSTAASWRLAAAYKLAGRNDVAESMINGLSRQVKTYSELSGSYGSAERDQAMILETLVLLGRRSEAKTVLDELAAKMSSGEWFSTQTTAYILLAAAKFVGSDSQNPGLNFKYQINQTKSDYPGTMPIARIDFGKNVSSSGKIQIENTGDKILFVKVFLKGIPLTGDATDAESNLNMSVKYLDMDGNPVDPAQIAQGTDFMAEVKIHHPGIRSDYKEMALTQIFPSGWEIRNMRMEAGPSVHTADKPRYMDIRDDRVYSYFDLNKNQTKTFRILLNAAYPGKFYLPSVYCEAMYDHSIHAQKGGKWVEVIDEW